MLEIIGHAFLFIVAFYVIAWAPVSALMACAFVMRYHRASYDKWGNPDKAAAAKKDGEA